MKNVTPEEAARQYANGLRVSYNTPQSGKPAILRTIKAGYPEGEPRYAFFYEDRSSGPDEGKFLGTTAAEAIRNAMNASREVFVQEVTPVSRVIHSKPGSRAICKICDGGPGNEGVCPCGAQAYEEPAPAPAQISIGEAVKQWRNGGSSCHIHLSKEETLGGAGNRWHFRYPAAMVFSTPEAAIRAELLAGRKVFLDGAEIVDLSIPEGIYWDDRTGNFYDAQGNLPEVSFHTLWKPRHQEFPKFHEGLNQMVAAKTGSQALADRVIPRKDAGLVPLGPNRTRDGKDVRVLANDINNPRFPVIYIPVDDEGTETENVRFVSATGSYLNRDNHPHSWDLVGHLPPEPAKPREFWILSGTVFSTNPDNADAIFVREVLP